MRRQLPSRKELRGAQAEELRGAQAGRVARSKAGRAARSLAGKSREELKRKSCEEPKQARTKHLKLQAFPRRMPQCASQRTRQKSSTKHWLPFGYCTNSSWKPWLPWTLSGKSSPSRFPYADSTRVRFFVDIDSGDPCGSTFNDGNVSRQWIWLI